MKFGYLEFRYGKRTGGPQESASLSINIGDNIQSLAVRNLFHRIGIPESEVVGVDRDDLPGYRGGPVRLLMNGCFYQRCFPLPETITPVFFGFNTASDGLVRHRRLRQRLRHADAGPAGIHPAGRRGHHLTWQRGR